MNWAILRFPAFWHFYFFLSGGGETQKHVEWSVIEVEYFFHSLGCPLLINLCWICLLILSRKAALAEHLERIWISSAK